MLCSKTALREADAFYGSITPPAVRDDPDRTNVMRQALAGMLWTKQYFNYDLDIWLDEHGAGAQLPQHERRRVRNSEWAHMYNDDIISMPDKWEYPWYAAWDLAFHMIPLGMVDPDFAKQQLDLMLRNDYLHPNGQLPAYEWNFGDVNPPVHAWATMQLYLFDKERRGGSGDIEFLKYAFSKLLINFTWWVNRKDRAGANVFEGGFLGLDNIGVFDRSSPLPTGGYLDQADGTAWMVFFSQQMLRIAVELALHEPLYEEFVEKFFQHTLYIAGAMDRVGDRHDEMWDEEDGFFYDVLRFPDGSATRLKVRSIVGLLPLAAVAVFEEDILAKLPKFRERARRSATAIPNSSPTCISPSRPGVANRRMLSIVDERKLRRILARMLDEAEFFGPHGIRALSRFHLDHPYVFHHGGQEHRVAYVPGDSDTGMFGGNSNWRGPVWMPINFLLYTALLRLYAYYGEDFKIECPTGSGQLMTLMEVAKELGERLDRTFLRDASGCRPVNGAAHKFKDDPHWRDLVLFYEYFHGDTGAGIGASHQTGWTGCMARIIQANAVMRRTCCSRRAWKPRRFGRWVRAHRADAREDQGGTDVNDYYAQMKLPKPVVPELPTLTLLKGQTALVTGANSGIGRAIALALGKAGRKRRRQLRGEAGGRGSGCRGSPQWRFARHGRSSGRRRRSAGGGDVRSGRARVRHRRHPRQQRRHGAKCAVPRDNHRAMGRRDERQSARRIPVLARGGPRVSSPRRASRGFGGRRQDNLHQLRARHHSVGRPCQLCGVEGRANDVDEEPGAGSRRKAHPRQRHRPRRDSHAHQHGGVGNARGLRRSHEARALQADRRGGGDRSRRSLACLRFHRLHRRNDALYRWRNDLVPRIRDRRLGWPCRPDRPRL